MNFKPLPPLTRLLTVLLKINVGILIVAVFGDIYGWSEYSKLPPSTDVSDTFLLTDGLNLVIGLIQFLFAIFLAITFLRWIHRANKNLHVLSSEPMTFSPGWSIGWYFIPIANLFKPYQAMKEIWTVAHRATPTDGSILGWWWFLWIVSNVLGRLCMKLAFRLEDAQSYANSAMADAVSDGVDIVLNIVALMLITRISRAYCKNYVEPSAGPNAVPPPPLYSGAAGGPTSVK
jgi:hypothetical protein